MLRFGHALVISGILCVATGACGDSDRADGSGAAGNSAGGGKDGGGAGNSAGNGGGGTGGKASSAGNGAGKGGTGGGGRGGGSGSAAGSGGTNHDDGGTGDDGGSLEAGSGGGSAPNTDESAELYDPEKLPRFDIELSEASIAALDTDPDTYARGTLRYGNTTVSDVGIRLKGEGTFRTLDKKAAFKLKFDEFVNNQSFRGLRRLTFNNLTEDKTFLAERLSYHVYRAAKLPAPRCNNALIYVNGTFYGVYANVETEDKTFLRRWFTSDDGNLYEEGQSDFEPGREQYFDLETNETLNDRSDLTTLVDAVDNASTTTFLDDIAGTLDTEHFLRFTAMEAAVNQWDMYAYTMFYPNNFRIYHDPENQRFVFLPWGMDLSMKPFVYTGRAHIPIFEPVHYEDNASQHVTNGLIFRRCVASAACKAKYTEILRETAELFDAAKLDELAIRYYDQIKSHVYRETRKELSNTEFDQAQQELLQTIRTRTQAIEADLQ